MIAPEPTAAVLEEHDLLVLVAAVEDHPSILAYRLTLAIGEPSASRRRQNQEHDGRTRVAVDTLDSRLVHDGTDGPTSTALQCARTRPRGHDSRQAD